MRRLTRSQRMLLAVQQLTDKMTELQAENEALRPVAEAVAANDFIAAAAAIGAARSWLSTYKAKHNRSFSADFKNEVCAMIHTTGHGQRAAVCKKLDVPQPQAYTWYKKWKSGYRFEDSASSKTTTIASEATLAKLEQARAAFSHLWKGQGRVRFQPSAPEPSAPPSVVGGVPDLQRAQQGVARKNSSPFRRI